MHLALISDLHGQKIALQYLEEIIVNYKIDAIVISGDITQYDETTYLKNIFRVLENSNTTAYLIWGNSDGPQVQKLIQNSKYNVHLKLRKVGNYKIIGLSETDQPVVIDPEKLRGSILVTHKPPLVKLLMRPYANAPKFHISGHLHTVKSVRKFASVTAIQVPTLQSGEFALFNTENEKVEFHRV